MPQKKTQMVPCNRFSTVTPYSTKYDAISILRHIFTCPTYMQRHFYEAMLMHVLLLSVVVVLFPFWWKMKLWNFVCAHESVSDVSCCTWHAQPPWAEVFIRPTACQFLTQTQCTVKRWCSAVEFEVVAFCFRWVWLLCVCWADELSGCDGTHSWRQTDHDSWRQRKHESLYCRDCFGELPLFCCWFSATRWHICGSKCYYALRLSVVWLDQCHF